MKDDQGRPQLTLTQAVSQKAEDCRHMLLDGQYSDAQKHIIKHLYQSLQQDLMECEAGDEDGPRNTPPSPHSALDEL